MDERAAEAFVPGHVTGFFSPSWTDDPVRTGSVGAGLTLADGVRASVEPADEPAIELDGEPVEMEPVVEVIEAFEATPVVRVDTSIPLGTGFGVSGAIALGTALAMNERFEAARSENELITMAHQAEVEAGTGLGDVVAQAHGGIPIRLEPGAPGHGHLDAIPTTATLEYVTFGELDTATVIGGDTTAIEAAGKAALATLRADPTLTTFVEASRRFSRETGLLTDRVKETIAAVDDAGGDAFMAMLGESVVALDSGLSDAGYDARQCTVHPPGATIVR
jgi:pantoate kinase